MAAVSTKRKPSVSQFPGWPDDKDGAMFERKLLRLRERVSKSPLPGRPETLKWRAYQPLEPDPTILRGIIADPLYYRLGVLEYEADHADRLRIFPICYEVRRTPLLGVEHIIASGPAPTIAEAKRRAKELWLACFGAKATLPPLNRLNDPEGANFVRMMQHIRARARHRKPHPIEYRGLAWVEQGALAGTPEVQSAMADYIAAGRCYNLLVVEYDDDYMRRHAPGRATIIWTIRVTGDDGGMNEVIAEAPAPSFLDAKKQCEAVFKIEIGAAPA